MLLSQLVFVQVEFKTTAVSVPPEHSLVEPHANTNLSSTHQLVVVVVLCTLARQGCLQ